MRTQSASLAILTAIACSTPASAEIVIGVIGSYSGFCASEPGGSESKVLKTAVEVAARQINDRGGVAGEKIMVAIRDAGCDVKRAHSAAQELSADRALLVIWHNFMGQWGVIGRKLADSAMVQVSPRADDPRFAAAAVQIWATAAARLDSRSRGEERKVLEEMARGEFDTALGTLQPIDRPRTGIEIVSFEWNPQKGISYSITRPLPPEAKLAQFSTGGPSTGSPSGMPSGPSTGGPSGLSTGGPSGMPSGPPTIPSRGDGRQDVYKMPGGVLIPDLPRDAIPIVGQYLSGGAWTRQEAPGRDVGGTATVPTSLGSTGEATVVAASIIPANSGVQRDEAEQTAARTGMTLPALPQPDEGDECKFPYKSISIPSDEAFLRLYLASIDKKAGRSSVPYCREGFADVVILDTGRQNADSLCSGVLLQGGWVLTAKHCVEDKFQFGRGVFQVPNDQADCLRRNSSSLEWVHPATACRLKSVDVDISRATVMTGGDLAIVPPRGSAGPQRGADISKVYGRARPLVTFAGYGVSTVAGEDHGGGVLRVGWGIANWEESSRDKVSIDVVGVSSGRTRRSTTPCGGDSGGPAFLGRVFGFDNERHELFGLVVKRTNMDRGCSLADTIDVSTRIVPLQSSSVLRWLCRETGSALTACRS